MPRGARAGAQRARRDQGFGEGRARRTLLDGVDLAVEPGELVAVVGRSGCGKSTLLNVLGGLDRAERGRIEIAGERIDGRSEKQLSRLRRRHVGFVFQFFHLLPELTGEANVMLAGGTGSAKRADELIARLGLDHVRRIAAAPAERRRAAALRDRARPGQRSARRVRRRADRQPRRAVRPGGPRPAARDRGRRPRGAQVTHQPEATAMADRVLALRNGRLEAE